jgi:hypothetical protein
VRLHRITSTPDRTVKVVTASPVVAFTGIRNLQGACSMQPVEDLGEGFFCCRFLGGSSDVVGDDDGWPRGVGVALGGRGDVETAEAMLK